MTPDQMADELVKAWGHNASPTVVYGSPSELASMIADAIFQAAEAERKRIDAALQQRWEAEYKNPDRYRMKLEYGSGFEAAWIIATTPPEESHSRGVGNCPICDTKLAPNQIVCSPECYAAQLEREER